VKEIFGLEDIFNVMIQLESLGNSHYNKMANMTDDDKLKKLFESLAKQELAHKELYTRYKNESISFVQEKVNDEYKEYIEVLLSGTINFINQLEEVDDYKRGFDIAINLEKDTIIFLIEVKNLLAESYHADIEKIIDQERGHLKALYKNK
jgi:rubrerythrin